MRQTHQSTRREFLKGQAAVGALRDVAEMMASDEALSLPEPQQGGHLVRIGRRAMACEFEVLLGAGQYPQGTQAAVEGLDLVERLESQLSVFRDDSEVSRLNRLAYEQDVEVEAGLFGLLERAAEIHRDTGGAYDITSGPLSKAWGFYRRAGAVPGEEALGRAMQSVGMQHVRLDGQRRCVRFARAGMEINLGSIGKGYALDCMAEVLGAAGMESFLLHGGSSSVLARGSGEAGGVKEGGWWVGVRHPMLPQVRIGEIRLRNRALGTSGSAVQSFMHEGKRYGHILDPRTGWPARDVLSVTVAAPTGATADALATAMYVMGVEASLDYCRRHPGLAAIIMTPGPEERVQVALFGLAEDEWKSWPHETIAPARVG